MSENISFKGRIELIKRNKKGKVVLYRRYSNVTCKNALQAVIRLTFGGFTENKFSYIAIGTGMTPETKDDTSLEEEIARKEAVTFQLTTVHEGDTVLLETVFTSDDGLSGTSQVSEHGIFNAEEGGILIARKAYRPIPINWDDGETLTVRHYIQATL